MYTETDETVEPTFVEEIPFEPDVERAIAAEHGLPFYVDIDRPDDVPADEAERTIDLAERVLSAAGRRTGSGHHEELRRSMAEWAPDRDEDRPADPGYWRQMVYTMSPRERNFGRLQGDTDEQLQKARTVLAWASDCIDEDVLRVIEHAQLTDIEQAWRDAAEAAKERRAIDAFEQDPPVEFESWTRFAADHDAVDVAYHAKNHGTPVVATVFRTSDESMDAQEFTLEAWLDAGGDPQVARPNRYCVTSTGEGPYARLRSHLQTFDVDSLAENSLEEC